MSVQDFDGTYEDIVFKSDLPFGWLASRDDPQPETMFALCKDYGKLKDLYSREHKWFMYSSEMSFEHYYWYMRYHYCAKIGWRDQGGPLPEFDKDFEYTTLWNGTPCILHRKNEYYSEIFIFSKFDLKLESLAGTGFTQRTTPVRKSELNRIIGKDTARQRLAGFIERRVQAQATLTEKPKQKEPASVKEATDQGTSQARVMQFKQMPADKEHNPNTIL